MSTSKPSKSGTYLDTDTWDAMKAAGFSQAELEADQPEGPMVFAYTRKMAIEDGALVDLMQSPTAEQPDLASLVREAGFLLPMVMTSTAFASAVSGEGEDLPAGQSIRGRLWDVLMLARHAIRRTGMQGDRVNFQASVDRGEGRHEIVNLYIHIGPGDDAEPVLTIMLQGED